jgi:hypothetical protein
MIVLMIELRKDFVVAAFLIVTGRHADCRWATILRLPWLSRG